MNSAQHIVPLTDFVTLRRQLETKKSRCQWTRDARRGVIPGAFRFDDKGQWYVNLDTYDEAVRKLSAPPTPSNTPDAAILQLAAALGLDQADLTLALRAART